ncbi:hypothetical protein [Streptomyces sp. HB132]|uniref:hypothetical protein n=1 Tax=Streptomyces sp. HB132 TaxID=767388 RepID=UPI0019604D1F|nr:hypothetical protein [Streptomyces sp. HB132]MBM7438988.1 hypothetical protein [Streptomyces sp. HB132]
MTGNAKIGAALVGGYLLGRTKKAKLAIGFGMFLAGKKLNLDPKQLGRMLADSPLLGTVNDQVRNELVGATKTAATKALTQRATGLADSLRKRTLELEDPSAAQTRDDEEEDGDEALDARDAPHDEDTDGEDTDGEDTEEKPAPRRTAAARKPARKSSESASKSAGGAASGARRSASGGPRKKAAPATRKTTSGARKAASSNARRDRGGSNG